MSTDTWRKHVTDLNTAMGQVEVAMQENHQREQYFFTRGTNTVLTSMLEGYKRPVVLCAPMLGKHMVEMGRSVTILDIDDRFADVPGFQHWDLHRPVALEFEPDIIFCDPPFYTVKLDRLYRAITTLTQGNTQIPLMMSWIARRQEALLGTFARYGLAETGYYPKYVSVAETVHIQVYTNLRGSPP